MAATANQTPTIEEIRDMVPATKEVAYMNTGTCGPMPRVAYEAMKAEHEKELTASRIDSDHFPSIGRARNDVREAVAKAINATPDDIAITHRTTEGMYIAIMGYRWERGDELILSNIEHPGGLMPSFLTKRRFGTRIRIADLGLGGGDPEGIVKAFEEQISPKTKMIVLSHISYTTGAKLPLKEITEMAHSYDVLVTVDAAQSFGSMQLDMQDLGVDFYAMPGQKWMCGPEGTGSLYVKPSSIGEIDQNFAGGALPGSLDYYGGSYAPTPGAARFDTAGQSVTQTAGQKAATEWVTQTVGMDVVADRIDKLSDYAYDEMGKVDGLSIVTPREGKSGLIAFNVEGIEPPDLSARLSEEHNVIIRYVNRYINNPDAARVSLGFYNNEEDIDKFIAGVKAVQSTL
ncbi:MAG: aminotransferase class V-fold PLP-dependent enzyme [Thermomicrobiales bacterium]